MLDELCYEAARCRADADVEEKRCCEVEREAHQQEKIHMITMVQSSLSNCKFT